MAPCTSAPVVLSEFAAQILAAYAVARRCRRTIDAMRRVLNELIAAVSPDPGTPAYIEHLTTAGIARWMSLKCGHRSPNTVIGLLGYVRAACSYAIDEGLLERQPSWRRIRPARSKPRKVRHHPARSVAGLLSHLEAKAPASWRDHRTYFLASLVALTGLRRDEALWLRKEDIHLEEGYLEVEPHHRRGVKTEESAQPVGMPPELLPIAAGWLAETPASRPWAVPSIRGEGPWWGGSPGYRPIDALQAAGREVGIEGLTFQSLRRSWATHAETLWGLTDPEIMRVLRHTTPDTSRLHYREADLDNLRRIAARVAYRRSAPVPDPAARI